MARRQRPRDGTLVEGCVRSADLFVPHRMEIARPGDDSPGHEALLHLGLHPGGADHEQQPLYGGLELLGYSLPLARDLVAQTEADGWLPWLEPLQPDQ